MSEEATGFRAQLIEHPNGLATLPNERREVSLRVEHVLAIPRCCPVSRNPYPGSTVAIRYRAGERLLEVYALKRYIEAFRGGHPDGTRNMETMIEKIAHDCAEAPEQQAAIITKVVPAEKAPGGNTQVSLAILYPTGMFFMQDVPYSESYERGHWSWPPRI